MPASIARRSGLPADSSRLWPTMSSRVRGRMRSASGLSVSDSVNRAGAGGGRRGIAR
ncbi:Hypothetical protein I596_1829 [Dokdonella koreensis DS-123]|uniref:Uncharacterized protein n=1 Tax=Dokdonella koreensis DS-123 TaxID=1300342 RepID=A0A167GVU8_9GAMM|nr:Hypothetical protein I596_1829 [Dokdonella koreensis DS-123]